MKCPPNSPPSFSGLSAELVDRFHRALERFQKASALSTTSSGPAPGSPAGSSPPGADGSTTSSPGTSGGQTVGRTDLLERLAALALRPPTEDGPPIRSYRLRPGVDGAETVAATEEYRCWFCRFYGVPRDEVPRAQDRAADAARERVAQTVGGAGLARFKSKPT